MARERWAGCSSKERTDALGLDVSLRTGLPLLHRIPNARADPRAGRSGAPHRAVWEERPHSQHAAPPTVLEEPGGVGGWGPYTREDVCLRGNVSVDGIFFGNYNAC